MLENLKNNIKKIEDEKSEEFKKHIKESVNDISVADAIIEDKASLFEFDKRVFKQNQKTIDNIFAQIKYPINEKNFDNATKFVLKNFPSKEVKVIIKNKAFKDLETYLQDNYELSIYQQYLFLMDAKRVKIINDLYAKMDQIGKMTKNLKVFGNLFGRFWDLSIHDLYSLPLEQIKKFAQLLKSKDFLNRIAEILGRLAQSQYEYEEYLIKEIKYSPNKK